MFDLSSVSRKEILRYLKSQNLEDRSLNTIIETCVSELLTVVKPSIVYEEYKLSITDNESEQCICFADVNVKSSSLARNLKGCEQICLFVATIGTGVDLLLRKNSVMGVSKVAIMQASGAALIEEYCDKWNQEYSQEKEQKGFLTRPRFSPGYGDFSIQHQRDFFRLLNCSKKIGVTLTDSMLMVPSKTVSAVIGIKKQ